LAEAKGDQKGKA
jgi:hypothetical protein